MGGRQVALLTEDETEQVVRLRMPIVAADRLGREIAGSGQLAAALPLPWRAHRDHRQDWPPLRAGT